MFKLIVDGKNGHEEGLFETEEAAQAHFDSNRAAGYWGAEAQVIEHEEIPAIQEVIENDIVVQEAVDVVPAWAENIPAEFTWEIVPIPQALDDISPRQIKTALFMLGITRDMISSAINTLPSPDKEIATIAWEESTSFVRSAPAVNAIGSLLGLSSDQLDQLWIAGKSL